MWYDCKDSLTECCTGQACAETAEGSGRYECQKEEIGLKTVTIGPLSLAAEDPEDDEPEPEPEPPNLVTTHDPTKPVTTKKACSSGDPHSKSQCCCCRCQCRRERERERERESKMIIA